MHLSSHRRLAPLGRGYASWNAFCRAAGELSSDGSLIRPGRVWLDRGSVRANCSELAAGREDHATTIRINRTWTNIRRGLGRTGTCPEPRCITFTIASAGRRRAATSTSAAAAVRRARCAQLPRHHSITSAYATELPCSAVCLAACRAAQPSVRRLARPSLRCRGRSCCRWQARQLRARLPLAGEWSLQGREQGRERFGFFGAGYG